MEVPKLYNKNLHTNSYGMTELQAVHNSSFNFRHVWMCYFENLILLDYSIENGAIFFGRR